MAGHLPVAQNSTRNKEENDVESNTRTFLHKRFLKLLDHLSGKGGVRYELNSEIADGGHLPPFAQLAR